MFKPLVNSTGEPFLLQLQAKYPSVAWHERSVSVFYLTSTTTASGSMEHSFNWLSNLDWKTYPSTSLAFEQTLLLKRVRLDLDDVLVDFEFSKALKQPVEIQGKTFVPGESYETRMPVREFSDPEKKAADLIADFYSKSRKK
jgi:hypothetical protein